MFKSIIYYRSVPHLIAVIWLGPLLDAWFKLFASTRKYQDRAVGLIEASGKQTLVDIGCGTGKLTHKIQTRYPELNITGIDIDADAIQEAKKNAQKEDLPVRHRVSSARDLPFKSNSVDIVFSSLTFHHLDEKEQVSALKEISRILKPDGMFYLFDIGQPASIFWKFILGLERYIKDHQIAQNAMDGTMISLCEEHFFIRQISPHFADIHFYQAIIKEE